MKPAQLSRIAFITALLVCVSGCEGCKSKTQAEDDCASIEWTPPVLEMNVGESETVEVNLTKSVENYQLQITTFGPVTAIRAGGEGADGAPADYEAGNAEITVTCLSAGRGDVKLSIGIPTQGLYDCAAELVVLCGEPTDAGMDATACAEPCTTPSDCGAGRTCGDMCCKDDSGSMSCTGDGDCAGGTRSVCEAGPSGMRCADCRADSDCVPGNSCLNNHCVDCTDDEDCDTGICGPRKTCDQCRTAADCDGFPGQPYCEGGQCLQCESDTDCTGDLPRCGDEGFCVLCATDADCTAPTGTCRGGRCSSCGSDSDCPSLALPNCISSGCGPCDGDFDCEVEYTCERGVGVNRSCSIECGADGDCDAGQRCFSGRCGMCEADTECPASAPFCGEANLCYQCTTDDPCTDGRVCSTRFGQCVDCQRNTDCTFAGLPRCAMNSCVGCLEDADCAHLDAGSICQVDGSCAAP